MAEPPQSVITRIEEFTEPESEMRTRLLEEARMIPITELDEMQIPATNQIIGRRIFERELGDQFSISGTGSSPKATWVREHLQDVGDDNVYRMWKRWSWFTAVEIPDYDPGGYDDMRRWLNLAQRVDLVTVARVEENPVQGRSDLQFYAVVEGNVDDPAWANVQEALYGGG